MSVRWTLEEVMDLLRENPDEPLPLSVDAQLAHDAAMMLSEVKVDHEEADRILARSKAFEGMSPTVH